MSPAFCIKALVTKSLLAIVLVIVLVLMALPTVAHAAVDLKNYKTRLETTQTPQYLFRWVNPYFLKDSDLLKSPLKLPKTDADDYVQPIKDLTKLFSTRVAFTWTNPVLGSHGTLNEHYGGKNAVLLVFEIKPESKALRLIRSQDDRLPLKQSIDVIRLKNASIIEHVTEQIHEWIIVKPSAIKAYSFDPKITYPLWKQFFLPYYLNPDFKPTFEDIHYRYYGSKNLVWGLSQWDKYRFFSDQIFAFNLTPGHALYNKISKIEWWQKPNNNLTKIKKDYGDLQNIKKANCKHLHDKELTAQNILDWLNQLKKHSH